MDHLVSPSSLPPSNPLLQRLYNDTKQSTLFVQEPCTAQDPRLRSLYRKLRIQQGRLYSWGLEWAEPVDMDTCLAHTGLGDLVARNMATTKTILAQLQLAARSVATQDDAARFDALVADLTVSIDSLFALSRSHSIRSASSTSKLLAKDQRAFASSRFHTPCHIDPNALFPLPSPSSLSHSHHVVKLDAASPCLEPEMRDAALTDEPLLLQHAAIDPIFAATGIMPDMARLEKLAAALQSDSRRAWLGLPRLLGFFEDLDNARLGLLYRFPALFNARQAVHSSGTLVSLAHLVSEAGLEPPLEVKFRLAYNLANTLFELHLRGVSHGALSGHDVLFGYTTSQAGTSLSDSKSLNDAVSETRPPQDTIDMRRPLLSSFDIFPCAAQQTSSPWHDPLDAHSPTISPTTSPREEQIADYGQLALLLLSIGSWQPLESVAATCASNTPPLDELTIKCGSLYAAAVRECFKAGKGGEGDLDLLALESNIRHHLEICCLLDDLGHLPTQEANYTKSFDKKQTTVTRHDYKTFKPSCSIPAQKDAPPRLDKKRSLKEMQARHSHHDANTPNTSSPQSPPRSTQRPPTKSPEVKPKSKLFTHIPLATDLVEKWNSTLMPLIDHALRSFYRKHAESVEVSLESIGPSPESVQPTVLVVCTSVAKVRAILKKKLAHIFGPSTGLALKVCRGHVVRSRNDSKPLDDSLDEARRANRQYQKKPRNGASIGAWANQRHWPPVSFGGLVLVNDKPYGMSVHHMFGNLGQQDQEAPQRSIAGPQDVLYSSSNELSDSDLESCSDASSFLDSDDESDDGDACSTPDAPGIRPDSDTDFKITQPALDDMGDDYYANEADEDDDHLLSCHLGDCFASSGIRGKQVNGLVHEIDWALFSFAQDRLPDQNCMLQASQDAGEPGSRHQGQSRYSSPTTVASCLTLPGMEVQCAARTSGQQLGKILPAITAVKLQGRKSMSHTYQVATISQHSDASPLGVPGDSGAWLVDCTTGALCAHILAWSSLKQVAYICPMEVLLADIAETLQADVRLPGGKPLTKLKQLDVVCLSNESLVKHDGPSQADRSIALGLKTKEQGDPVEAEQDSSTSSSQSECGSRGTGGVGLSFSGTCTPVRMGVGNDLRGLANRLEQLKSGIGRGIGVS
ncbi:hypothetical protein CDD81_249 [Ophiocordyceps australis]|uniref:Prion-inhibition and propagation HeLo domain-containing protein n=1 Tax=Ophiocordyceps australis TaxID=1399860 RepID=A0A2C5YEQ4_9HYPO|nr:hypothetical protein CDD81_249 [Ophiocordyceps australis]